jgi:exocyst complex protein 7
MYMPLMFLINQCTVVVTQLLASISCDSIYTKSKLEKQMVTFEILSVDRNALMMWQIKSQGSVGDDWVQRQRRIVQQHANAYECAAWAKVTSC